MPDVKLHVATGPTKPAPWDLSRPYVGYVGVGTTNYLCGTCGYAVAKNLSGTQITNGQIVCVVCGSKLDAPAA